MKYALVNGDKLEAIKGLKGTCPSCGSELIAKCGALKVNHWAHKGIRNCDVWWENETEWHRNWKNKFQKEWQEIVHFDSKGEKHIADIKTDKDWVIEFQHSFLTSGEQISRNIFYKKLVWVVDGLRRKTDISQFQNVLNTSSQAPIKNINIRKVRFPEESRLLREWLNCKVPVFFDFIHDDKSPLWFLLPFKFDNEAYILSFSRIEFINVLKEDGFDELVLKLIPNIEKMINIYYRKVANGPVNNIFLRQPRRMSRGRRF